MPYFRAMYHDRVDIYYYTREDVKDYNADLTFDSVESLTAFRDWWENCGGLNLYLDHLELCYGLVPQKTESPNPFSRNTLSVGSDSASESSKA